MGFFNQLGAKAMNVRGTSKTKIWEASEIKELNTQINGLKKEQKEVYEKIGMQYAEICSRDCDPSLEPLMKKLGEINQQIQSLSELVTQLRGLRTCPECGAQVGWEDVFCCSCGTSLPEVDLLPEGYVRCSACGGLSQSGTKFCTKCGSLLEACESREYADVELPPLSSPETCDDEEPEKPEKAEKEKIHHQESLRNKETKC